MANYIDCGKRINKGAKRCDVIASRKPSKHCMDCGKEFARRGATCINKRCRSCYDKSRATPRRHCNDCEREIAYTSKSGLCRECLKKLNMKNRKINHCIACGSVIGGRAIRCKSCASAFNWTELRYREKTSYRQSQGWSKPGVKESFGKIKANQWANFEYANRVSELQSQGWTDEARAKASATRKRKLANGEIILKTQNPSKLELNILRIMQELGIKCQGQHRIDGYSYFYDIFIPKSNLLIEVDGEYWHYSEDAIANGIPERDAEKTKIAEDSGYKLLRLRESDIRAIGFEHIIQQRVLPLL